jgi:hypothetical protein
MGMWTSQIRHHSNLENTLQQIPGMTEQIERIESYISTPIGDIKVEIRIDRSKYVPEDKHREMRNMDPTILTIYADGSGVKGKSARLYIYNSTANEATHRNLG